ncbi:MAG: adenylate/guanylate cyclase domain-containing protein [Candidatus Riflebacteria bacterium]|nr:adenylate/guanylate cyclase domain-containing protein [Candidatus Riflebacteria bacterium]
MSKLTIEQLLNLKNLQRSLDDTIEELQYSSRSLEYALQVIYKFLNESIQISGFFVQTMDESLKTEVYSFGRCAVDSDTILGFTKDLHKKEKFILGKLSLFFQPVDMAGNIIGYIALAYDDIMAPETEFGFEILNCVSEILDNYFFSIHLSSVKHRLFIDIQLALKNTSLLLALDEAITLLRPYAPHKKIFIVYTDKELTNRETVHYIYYEDGIRLFDSTEKPFYKFDRFVRAHDNYLSASYDEIKNLFSDDSEPVVSYLRSGYSDSEFIGMVAVMPDSLSSLSVFSREVFQVLIEELRQRLIDLNREQNILRKYFSNLAITRLIKEPDYIRKYLSPRTAEIGILFADLCGFTKISEQILKKPERINSFINKWSKGVVKRVFPLGASLDKLVGDCLIFLFGPPFYEDSAEIKVKHALQAANLIVNYTKDFLSLPENEDISQHPDFEFFGVSVAVNYCKVVVGLTGPNEDLTAFSSGVNNTARLQGIAGANTVLVTNSVRDIASASENWVFEGPDKIMVKNVKDPITYYKLKLT